MPQGGTAMHRALPTSAMILSLVVTSVQAKQAQSASQFLSSLGVNTHNDQGYNASAYVAMLQYTGIKAVRDGGRNLINLVRIHQQTGVLFDIVTGCDVQKTLDAARTLARVGALLSVEGANEPNNFPILFDGQKGGGSTGSWLPVAKCQAALYAGVKGDSTLKNYPVFHVSEGGAEVDNVGMQFLTVPRSANIKVADGTKFADYANPHNFASGHVGDYIDNMPWSAADPTLNGPWDGLYGEYGRTWHGGFEGYSQTELNRLPRVTTETGWDSVGDKGGETVQAKIISNVYLAQFTRGWRYTFIYELVDEEGSTGNHGLYRKDHSPKPAADYIHALTTILADKGAIAAPEELDYTVAGQPETVHDLLLQKSDGTFELVVWGERARGSNDVTVQLGTRFETVRVYDISRGPAPWLTSSHVSSLPLTLSDHAVIIEMTNTRTH
jgi:hypothetical protein